MTRYLCHKCETFSTPCEFDDHDMPCSARPLPKACAWSGDRAEWKIAADQGVPIAAPAIRTKAIDAGAFQVYGKATFAADGRTIIKFEIERVAFVPEASE